MSEANDQNLQTPPVEKNIEPPVNGEEIPQEQNQKEEIEQEQEEVKENQISTEQIDTIQPESEAIVLQSLFDRGGAAVKPTNFSVEVIGIYSLPEFLLKLDTSGACDAWEYQVKVSEATVSKGKMNPRELTDEEKNAEDNKKKGPPKIDKKNPDAVREEEERLAKIQQEKEEYEKKFYDELHKLDLMSQFYKIKEMSNQAEWVSFSDENKINTVELSGEPLLKMENSINGTKNIIIEVNKVPPPDEDPKKRPKPKNMNPDEIVPVYTVGLADLSEFYNVPGKKEVILRTPLMLKETYDKRIENNIQPLFPPFTPGENDLKVYLFGPPVEEKGKKDDKKDKKEEEKKVEEEKKEEEGENQIELDYVEKAHTYIYYKLSFSESINPKLKGPNDEEPGDLIQDKNAISAPNEKVNKSIEKEEIKENPNHSELIDTNKIVDALTGKDLKSIPEKEDVFEEKKEEEEEVKKVKPIAADEICNDFRKYIKIFIANICKSYDETMGAGDSNKNPNVKRDKGGAGSILNNVKKEERDKNINNFLLKYIENGKAGMIKEKFKKMIIRIAVEKYKKRININEKFEEQKDKFFSSLYAYISDEIKLGMDEYYHLKRDEINEYILSSYEQSRKEIKAYAIRENKEPEERRLLRLSREYDILDDLEVSMQYYKSRLTLIQNKESWLNFAILAKKLNSLVDVEEAVNNCIRIIGENQELLIQNGQTLKPEQIMEEYHLKILYGSIKYLKNRIKDAIEYMDKLLNKYELKNTNCIFNAFFAFLYHEQGNKLLFTKHYEAAKRFKMIELGMNLRKPKVNPKVKTEYKTPILPVEQCDKIWYTLINFFNTYQFYEISEKLLKFINEENQNTIQFKLAEAEIRLEFKDNDKVIELCDDILNQDEKNYQAWTLRGHAYFYLNNLFDSEESYVKGIKTKPQNIKFDIKLLTRLGIIYIRRKTWNDAKTVFMHILKDSVLHSFAWRYLGLALTRLNEFIAAEEALNEAVLLDIENPISRAYMTMFCIEIKRNEEAYDCLNELIKMKFNDTELLNEIAQLFYKNDDYVVASNLYKRIIHFNKNFVDAYIKLAEIYYMKFDENKKKEAIEILKNSLEFTTDEKEKESIEEFINVYENQLGNNSNEDNNEQSHEMLNMNLMEHSNSQSNT